MRIAVIDIGTMTTRLLIADFLDGEIHELVKEMKITHLGLGLNDTGVISADASKRVLATLIRYKEIIDANKVDQVLAIATSAVRDAQNGAEFLASVHKLGIPAGLISGELEAKLAFAGATYGREREKILVCDVGGGSTELSFRTSAEDEIFSQSFELGARRLNDMFFKHDPVTADEREALLRHVEFTLKDYFASLPTQASELIALAGSATTLVTIKFGMTEYDKDFVQGQKISQNELDKIAHELITKNLDERQKICGLEPERAHVAHAGALILQKVLELSGVPEMTISDNDILYGIILNAEQMGA